MHIFLAAILLASCNRPATGKMQEGNEAPATGGKGYSYHPENGKCLNAAGKEGYNALDLAAMGASKDCECVDLGKTDLVLLIPGLDPSQHFAYNVLRGYNFKGANFQQAQLHFNHFEECDFSGAKMKGFSFGYTHIKGIRDSYTEFPDEGCQQLEVGVVDCVR